MIELAPSLRKPGECKIAAETGWHLSDMFDAMERGELTTLYVLGENPADSEADRHRALKLLSGLEFLVVQDLFLHQDRRTGGRGAARRRRRL